MNNIAVKVHINSWISMLPAMYCFCWSLPSFLCIRDGTVTQKFRGQCWSYTRAYLVEVCYVIVGHYFVWQLTLFCSVCFCVLSVGVALTTV